MKYYSLIFLFSFLIIGSLNAQNSSSAINGASPTTEERSNENTIAGNKTSSIEGDKFLKSFEKYINVYIVYLKGLQNGKLKRWKNAEKFAVKFENFVESSSDIIANLNSAQVKKYNKIINLMVAEVGGGTFKKIKETNERYTMPNTDIEFYIPGLNEPVIYNPENGIENTLNPMAPNSIQNESSPKKRKSTEIKVNSSNEKSSNKNDFY